MMEVRDTVITRSGFEDSWRVWQNHSTGNRPHSRDGTTTVCGRQQAAG